jgi:hypothetical protein
MKDGILLALIAVAEDEENRIEHEVTLLIGGFLVSGFVVSRNKYLQSHPTTGAISNVIERLRAEDPKIQVPENEAAEFIHLRDAKFFVPGGKPIPDNASVYWRGRLESVDGFTLGLLVFAEG